MTPNQALILYVIAAVEVGRIDHAFSVLIEEGVLKADQNIESEAFRQARDDVQAEFS